MVAATDIWACFQRIDEKGPTIFIVYCLNITSEQSYILNFLNCIYLYSTIASKTMNKHKIYRYYVGGPFRITQSQKKSTKKCTLSNAA